MKPSMRRDLEKTSPVGDRIAEYGHDAVPVENPKKSRWDRSWPVIACGAGSYLLLFGSNVSITKM